MRIGVIGAGISGLTIAKLLHSTYEVEILEKDGQIGGIARTKIVDGIPYHQVGGHCLNSKNPDVMDFVYSVLPRHNWHAVERKSEISLLNHTISYPIEFAIKEIASFDSDLAFRITKDFFMANGNDAESLEGWFRENFGNELAELYFIPYNTKIWAANPAVMSPQWVKGKLPIPNRKQFFQGLIGNEKDTMPHSNFYYPNNNTQNQFIEALSTGLNICLNYDVTNIEKFGEGWLLNGEKKFDFLISTMPLNLIPLRILGAPDKVKEAARSLKYNKVSNMLWRTEGGDATWTYFPEPSTIFHRHIHIGNFLLPKLNFTITEAIGEVSPDIMEKAGKNMEGLLTPIDYHTSEHAYVVYDFNYKSSVKIIKEYLMDMGIVTLGRFGEWEYYNMDVCIESAMNVARNLCAKY